MRERSIVVFCAVLAVASLLVVVPESAGASTPAAGGYTAVAPARLLDTRTGNGAHRGSVGAHQSVTFAVSGRAGVPSTASAVVLNITVTQPTLSGFLTASAAGHARPTASNVNFVKGRTVPNLAVVRLGTGGQVSLYNGSSGRVQVLADVQGYFTGQASTAQGTFASVAPTRLLDTRSGTGAPKRAVGGGKTVSFVVTGQHGSATVPSTPSAVVLNVTVTGATASGHVTAYGSSRPGSSNLNFVKGSTVPNLAVVPVGADGRVTLYNSSTRSVQLIADLQGYVIGGDPTAAGAFGALSPVRLLDTRTGNGAKEAAVGAHKTVTVSLFGRGGVPRSAVSAVVLNVTVTSASAGGYLTAYSGHRPTASNLNFAKGQTIANLVVAKPSSGGTVTFYNGSSGSVQVIADGFGYVRSNAAPSFKTSTSHYVRSISAAPGGFADPTTTGQGCADAEAGSTLVLLDIGAQLNNKTGVALTVVNTAITYDQLVSAVNAYLTSFAACHTGAATVAVGTNNDGTDWTTYTATARGADWANKVVDAISAPAGITIEGADDIEGGFFSTEAQAKAWEDAYLGATSSGLLFNGSADGCPSTYGSTASCAFGWTQAQLFTLAGGSGAGRTRAVPQVYTSAQAVQWANIAATGGSVSHFLGALTEHAACPKVASGCPVASQTAAFGWAALYHALSTVSATPSLPYVTDLKIN